jgi:hypothetical protein
MLNVKGTSRAMAIVAVNPGRAPTMMPDPTPRMMMSIFRGVNRRLRASAIITFYP